MIKIAINGLGRIGRLVLRSYIEQQPENIELVAVNSPSDGHTIAHLIKYDSVHGTFPEHCEFDDSMLHIGNHNIPVLHERNPSALPWKNLGVDIVLECSGKFNSKELGAQHIGAGAKKVLVSAPCKNADATIVIGVNHQLLNDTHQIISAASCTTNALAPIAKIMHENFGIESGYMTTIHAYTGDQNLVDNSHKDLRRARAAASSMIPTKTGAAESLKLVIPELEGRIGGSAIRVPTANVSLIDLTVNTTKTVTAEGVNEVMAQYATTQMKDILSISPAPLTSCDFNHTTYSSIFDPYETKIVNHNLARIVSWYDNELGFACRMLDLCNQLKIILAR